MHIMASYPAKCPGVMIDGQISVCYNYNTITNIPRLQPKCLLMCTNVYKTSDDFAYHMVCLRDQVGKLAR